MEMITFSRQQLYDLVWSESLLALSKKYDISDNGLRKACKRMNIPLPEMGHWNKVAAGKKVAVKPLPKENSGENQIKLTLRIEGASGDRSSQSVLQQQIEADFGSDLVIQSQLSDPDNLVSKAQKELLQKSRRSKDIELVHAGPSNLGIRVSEKLINRALCIMDAFIKVMRKRGHDFSIENGESYLLIAGVKMKMVLRELQNKVVIKERWERTEYHPNGILSFRFERYVNSASCTDGKVLIENQLSKLIAKLELLGEQFKIEEEKNRRWREEYEEDRRIEEELAERKRKELGAFQQLLNESRRWKEVETLREYIDQIEQKAISENMLTEEMESWLDWARGKADWFDPLVSKPDEWLKGVDPCSITSQVSTNSSNSFNSYQYSNSRKEKYNWPLLPWYLKDKK